MPLSTRLRKHFGDHLMPDDSEPVLAYHNITLKGEDLRSINDEDGWLTDMAIAFWQEYLEYEWLSQYPTSHIVLLQPMFVRLLVETRPEHFEGMREAFRDLTKTTHIFIPVSDARPTDASGRRADEGTHWSLLLVSLIDGVAFHYDSLRSHDGRSTHNMRYAQHAASQISRFVGKPIQMLDLDDTPKQHNGSDCGVFVCMQMRHLLMRRLLSANSRQKISMSMAGKMVDSQGARKEMMKIIDGFIKQGNARRRSADDARRSSSASGKGKSKSPPRIE